MTQTAAATQQQACTCHGTGLVQVDIENSATGQTITLTQTCLDCL